MVESRHKDLRREAWRKFYLENYPDAVQTVGEDKPKIDAYVAGLWKSIGSKGREAYTNSVGETISNAQQSSRPQGTNGSSSTRRGKDVNPKDAFPEINKAETGVLESAAKDLREKSDVKNEENEVGIRSEIKAKLETEGRSPKVPTRAIGDDWPRKLTSRFSQCLMLTRKKTKLKASDNIELSVSSPKGSDKGNSQSSAVVRLCKSGREFARLDAPFASALGAAMQTGLVHATCSIIEPPVATAMFSAFYAEVSVFIEEAAFVDFDSNENPVEGIRTMRMAVIRMTHSLNLAVERKTKPISVVRDSSVEVNDPEEDNSIDSYFTSVKRVETMDAKGFEQPRSLASSLREYQKAGVSWMVARENYGCPTQLSSEIIVQGDSLWKRCTFEGGDWFFVNAVTGDLSLNNPTSGFGGPRGGILADEMGLGKTVQCIACLVHDLKEGKSSSDVGLSPGEEEDFQESFLKPTENTKKVGIRGNNVASPPAKKQKREKSAPGAQPASAVSLLMANARDSSTAGGTLIICPMSLVAQWMDELSFHVKPNSLRVLSHYGNVRGDEKSICAKSADVVVTSYGVLASEFSGPDRSSAAECGPLFKLQWRRIILDEAHTIKSRSTRWAKAAYRLEAERRWCVTGTVIHNHINDVFSLLHFLRLEPWSTWGVWTKSVADPLESKDESVRDSAMGLVRDILSSVTLRRTKATKDSNGKAIIQMTKKTVQVVKLTPSSEERDFYESLHARTKVKFNSFLAQGNVLKNYASVLEMLLRLRQACDHPYLVVNAGRKAEERKSDCPLPGPDNADFDNGTPKRSDKDLQEGGSITRECPICLDVADDPVALPECDHVLCRVCLAEALQRSKTCPICNKPTSWNVGVSSFNAMHGINGNKWKSSAKIDELVKDMTERRNLRKDVGQEVGKSVVFSQFTSMLDIAEIALRKAKFSFLRIDGSVPQAKRSVILKQFNSERELAADSCNILLLSTRTGGVGLNLTSASFAILLDINWNPQVDAQAQDRIHRHGQTRDVDIKRYIVKDSVEEKLLEVQARKEKLAHGALEEAREGEDRQARLSELKLLFSS